MNSWVLSLFWVCFWAGKGDMASHLSAKSKEIDVPEHLDHVGTPVSVSNRASHLSVKSKEIDVPEHLDQVGRSVSVSKRDTAEIVNNTNIYHPSDSTVTQSVQDMCVYAHNYVRALHGVGNLTWSSTLGNQAAAYAKHMADTGSSSHSSGSQSGQYGENLYASGNSFGGVASVAHAVYSWYSESWRPNNSPQDKNYDYTFNPTDVPTLLNAKTGHFTAVVWKDTTQVGCGVATINDKTYIVAMYTSAGNSLGNFLDNVLPLTSGDASLNGQLDVIDLVQGISDCGDFISSSTCAMYNQHCSIVGEYCDCAC